MSSPRKQKIVVVGAGPVGALAAFYAARRGYEVEVYELREDLRNPQTTLLNFTRSINLAVSERGLNSLKQAGCPRILDTLTKDSIPMYGRMIHGSKNGKLFEQSQAYDVYGRAIRAADRAGLNKLLLDELEKLPNVKLFFNRKLTGADFKSKHAWFELQDSFIVSRSHSRRRPEIEVSFDFMIGADGAHSAVRFHLMKFARVTYYQEYIDTLWCEFSMPPATDKELSPGRDGFRISPSHLHIWPAGSFMFIAIPNLDKSFTCTLFLSAAQFEAIDSDTKSLVPFFNKHFPGVVPALISPTDLEEQYTTNPHLPLISLKCTPYHYSSAAVVIGDAAHAMVPFYGQGMNAGLEDVRVLFEILDATQRRLAADPATTDQDAHAHADAVRAAALREYTEARAPDAHAINDLAMGNYREMRSDVRSLRYRLRKALEEWLSVHVPALGFATQYARVSFSNQPYAQVVESTRRQGAMLELSAAALGLGVAAASLAAWRWRWRAR